MEAKIEKINNIIFLKIIGETDLQSVKQSLKRAYEECKKYDCMKLLLDLYDVDFENITDQKRIVFATIVLDVFDRLPSIEIAAVLQGKNITGLAKEYTDMRLLKMKAFTSKNEAIDWLNELDYSY